MNRIDIWGRIQTIVIDGIEVARSLRSRCSDTHVSYSFGYAEAKRDVLIEITQRFNEIDEVMKAVIRDAERYRWLRTNKIGIRVGITASPHEAESLDRVCDAGVANAT